MKRPRFASQNQAAFWSPRSHPSCHARNALAFVAGMIPLLFSRGVGASFNQATAGVVVGGQTLSLVLTLLVTPVAYSLLDDASAWFKRKFGSKRSPEETGEGEVERAYGGDTLAELRPAHGKEAA